MRWRVLLGMVGVSATVGWVTTRFAPAVEGAPASMSFAGYDVGLQRLDSDLVSLDRALARGDRAASLASFTRARRDYKRVELFVEYYGGGLARELNGVPMPKAEDEDPETPLAPVGLQMVEATLFTDGDSVAIAGARRYVPSMRIAVGALRRAGADTMPGDEYLFDAMRHELARVSTLGLAGFDATLSGHGMRESADALEGIRQAMRPYAQRADVVPGFDSVEIALTAASLKLRAAADSSGVDRLELIARHLVPAAHHLAAVQRRLGIGPPQKPRAWSRRAASPYDRGAFDARFFAATDAPPATEALVSLGRDLFFDPSLSRSGRRSCATCHLPARAFTDGRARATLLTGGHGGRRARNTPTLIDAALQPSLFADGRVRTLEDQATDVIGSAAEMGGSLAVAGAALVRRPVYRRRFAAVVSGPLDSASAARTIRLALAAYVRSLVRLDSRFDRAARGVLDLLTSEERRGFDLFMGKAGCGTCHFAPLFGGAMPPALVENEPEVIGVPATPRRSQAQIDPDSGRFTVRRIAQHLHAFKTPSLRNVALTAPYMHNGVYATLEEVLDFYDAGGGHGIGAVLSHQTLPTDSLHLSRAEKRGIIAFLGTLTDTSATSGRPSARRP
jgi:cytochrome c peroxidase